MRHLLAGYDLSTDRLYGHLTRHKGRTEFLTFVCYLRSLHPPEVRIAIVIDNFSPHLSTTKDQRVGRWAAANNIELAHTPHYTFGSTGSRPNSRRCGTSPSTEPITPATTSKPA